jgi:hypothetical protein
MFELVETIAMFCVHLMLIALSIVILIHLYFSIAELYRKGKKRKPKVNRKFPIPSNQHLGFKKTFKTVKYIRRR